MVLLHRGRGSHLVLEALGLAAQVQEAWHLVLEALGLAAQGGGLNLVLEALGLAVWVFLSLIVPCAAATVSVK